MEVVGGEIIEDAYVGGAVIVVAKCPVAGVSKTRLAPLLGAEGAAMLAQAMLSDILISLSECVSSLLMRLLDLSMQMLCFNYVLGVPV